VFDYPLGFLSAREKNNPSVIRAPNTQIKALLGHQTPSEGFVKRIPANKTKDTPGTKAKSLKRTSTNCF
jgi:hypothetical protein